MLPRATVVPVAAAQCIHPVETGAWKDAEEDLPPAHIEVRPSMVWIPEA